MKFWFILFCLLLTVAVATTPVAQAATTPRDVKLSDSEEPGSVLVFPIFRRGSVTTSDLGTVPLTEFEISVVCPPNQTDHTCFVPGDTVHLHAEWVCGGDRFHFCAESDFRFDVTVGGTVRFNPDNIAPFTVPATPPPCGQGYLMVWAENSSQVPIKFDALIGDAVLRESAGALSAYNAIPIQADPALATGAVTIDPNDNNELHFDGLPGHYLAVTGKIYGSVRYGSSSAAGSIATSLVLLTLDIDSNRPQRSATFVDLNFYSENENLFSTSTNFVCWERDTKVVPLSSQFSGATKGLVASNRAFDISDNNRTLLGLIITQEKNSTPALLREYAHPFYNDSFRVDTEFEYNPGGLAK